MNYTSWPCARLRPCRPAGNIPPGTECSTAGHIQSKGIGPSADAAGGSCPAQHWNCCHLDQTNPVDRFGLCSGPKSSRAEHPCQTCSADPGSAVFTCGSLAEWRWIFQPVLGPVDGAFWACLSAGGSHAERDRRIMNGYQRAFLTTAIKSSALFVRLYMCWPILQHSPCAC